MRQFIAFIKKEFYHIFRDRRTMLILLGMPVVQIILFGFAISTEVKNVRLAVLDPSNDVVTRKIIDRLDASEYFTVTARFHSPQEMEAAFLKNEVDMAIVFSERFADDLYTGDARVQLIVDATDPNMSTSQVNYATGIVSMVGQEMIPPNMSAARLTPDIKLLYNPQMKSAYNFVPGVMGLILMLICAMMTSISIVREKETGTMEVLLVSPVKPLFIILAKAVPYFVLSFVNLITILLLSVFVLDVPVVEYTPRALVFCDGQLIADRSASAVLCDPELIERAALKETSLYTLANRCGIAPAEDFVERFIAADREVRAHGC